MDYNANFTAENYPFVIPIMFDGITPIVICSVNYSIYIIYPVITGSIPGAYIIAIGSVPTPNGSQKVIKINFIDGVSVPYANGTAFTSAINAYASTDLFIASEIGSFIRMSDIGNVNSPLSTSPAGATVDLTISPIICGYTLNGYAVTSMRVINVNSVNIGFVTLSLLNVGGNFEGIEEVYYLYPNRTIQAYLGFVETLNLPYFNTQFVSDFAIIDNNITLVKTEFPGSITYDVLEYSISDTLYNGNVCGSPASVFGGVLSTWGFLGGHIINIAYGINDRIISNLPGGTSGTLIFDSSEPPGIALALIGVSTGGILPTYFDNNYIYDNVQLDNFSTSIPAGAFPQMPLQGNPFGANVPLNLVSSIGLINFSRPVSAIGSFKT